MFCATGLSIGPSTLLLHQKIEQNVLKAGKKQFGILWTGQEKIKLWASSLASWASVYTHLQNACWGSTPKPLNEHRVSPVATRSLNALEHDQRLSLAMLLCCFGLFLLQIKNLVYICFYIQQLPRFFFVYAVFGINFLFLCEQRSIFDL